MNPLVHGPVLGTLLGLTWPNLVAMGSLVFVSVAETWVVGQIGLPSLAAMSLVFPSIILMQNLSGGSIGGGVASEVSQAIGRGQGDEAGVVAFHGLIVGLAFGLLFCLFFLTLGPSLYRLLGGEGEVLAIASGYSLTVFAALPVLWVSNVLASILRGTGNMRVPSRATVASAVLQIVVGASLGLGLGPLPALGMVGVALGQVLPMMLITALMFWFVASGRAGLRLAPGGRLPRLRLAVFAGILRVGLTSCLQPLQSMIVVMIFSRLVASHGVEALAAYGIGARLEILLMNITWAVGGASMPMVGMAIGHGDTSRARRVAWIAAAVAASALAVIGGLLALAPDLWLRLFTHDPATLDAGRQYLQRVGPCLPFLGIGTALYFSSQAAGRVLAPVLASSARLLLVIVGGWLLQTQQAPLGALFTLIGVAMAVYGLGAWLAVRLTRWGNVSRTTARVSTQTN
jgi:Na+-driven multidrug efflux pump